MNSSQRNPLRLLLSFVLLLVLCVGVTYISVRMMTEKRWAHDGPHGHQWLHQQLGLTDEEAARLDQFEEAYRAERRELQAEFDRRVEALAEILATHDSYSPEVTAAVHAIHEVHGRLQQLAIEHYFEMLNVLPPEKQELLRNLAVEALSEPE